MSQAARTDYQPRYAPSLRDELTSPISDVPAWVNLWRRSDYLGFPVASYNGEGNPIDRGATESDPNSYLWQVARHAGYQFTLQYRAGLHEVIDRLGQR